MENPRDSLARRQADQPNSGRNGLDPPAIAHENPKSKRGASGVLPVNLSDLPTSDAGAAVQRAVQGNGVIAHGRVRKSVEGRLAVVVVQA